MIRTYGIIGFIVIVAAELLLYYDVRPVPLFFTPIVWWGYILFADSLVFRMRGSSLITSYPRTFLCMLPISIGCWLIFELYNLHLANWEYVNLAESFKVRVLGYVLAFSTIFPGIYETAHLIQALFFPDGLAGRRVSFSHGMRTMLIVIGAVFMITPLLVPKEVSSYLFALVWIGFIPLLDPINRKLGAPSITAQLENGDWETFLSFALSGIVCGFLWEFWNYWALARWVYHVPFWSSVKIFEMPVPGFLGFIPFALECYVMFNLCASVLGIQYVHFPRR
ncbi:MAG: hypothetical protein ACE5OP_00335 [Candidatus Glassbacteria bacterium]